MELKKGCSALLSTIPTLLGARHLLSAARHTVDGFRACFRSEIAFRQEVLVGVLNLIAVALLPMQMSTRLGMIALWVLLICVELLNSSIEAVVDLASPEWHELAKRAKDCGSAAVFCMLFLFVGSWSVYLVSLVRSLSK